MTTTTTTTTMICTIPNPSDENGTVTGRNQGSNFPGHGKPQNNYGGKTMKVYKEVNSAYDFCFWSGGKETAEDLTTKEIEEIFSILEELYPDGIDETSVNDIFWFERDWIAEMLGYLDYENLLSVRNN